MDEIVPSYAVEVWRIFGEEAASPTEHSPTSAVSAHACERYSNGSFHDVNTTISPSFSIRNTIHHLPMPAPQRPHSPEIRSQPDTATSPTQRLRLLPLPPCASLGLQPHDQPPVATPCPGTPGVDGRRQLPQAPTVQPNGYNGSRPSTGSATFPTSSTSKPVVTDFHADGLQNIHKAVPAVPSHTSGASVNGVDGYRLQQLYSSLDVQGYGVAVAPKPSPRPPGASPTNIPGHSNIFDDFSIECPMDSGTGGFQGGSMDSLARARLSVYSGTPGPPLGDQEEEDDDYFYSESDDLDPDRFVDFSLLWHLAVRLRDKVPRGTHVKSIIPYPRAFSGKDIVIMRTTFVCMVYGKSTLCIFSLGSVPFVLLTRSFSSPVRSPHPFVLFTRSFSSPVRSPHPFVLFTRSFSSPVRSLHPFVLLTRSFSSPIRSPHPFVLPTCSV
ncbi:hypothetical protein EDD22DRAFT_993102 [Suillus occidentalis]|nr:hypothetical protein EDD22DRAFT_993102 [Suillus occidentalis]